MAAGRGPSPQQQPFDYSAVFGSSDSQVKKHRIAWRARGITFACGSPYSRDIHQRVNQEIAVLHLRCAYVRYSFVGLTSVRGIIVVLHKSQNHRLSAVIALTAVAVRDGGCSELFFVAGFYDLWTDRRGCAGWDIIALVAGGSNEFR